MSTATAVDYTEVLGLLERAKERISVPEHWTTFVYAKNADGLASSPAARDACRWCASGSLLAELFGSSNERRKASRFLREAALDLYGSGIVTVNDIKGHASVMRTYDRAITVCRGFVVDA